MVGYLAVKMLCNLCSYSQVKTLAIGVWTSVGGEIPMLVKNNAGIID